jgi:cobalt-zinc-cadmium efflux system membrane fusion protein
MTIDMKMNLKQIVSLLVFVAAIIGGLIFVFGGEDATPAKDGTSAAPVERPDDDQDAEAGSVELSAASAIAAGIVVEPVRYRSIGGEVNAPGIVKLNSYMSSSVTPRIAAQIVTRHARLGDVVKKGQPLVTLTSVEVAEALGQLLVSHREWLRVKELGMEIVSAKRFNDAKVAYEQARSKAMAYGLPSARLTAASAAALVDKPGEFQLRAPQDGTITSDDFIIGELI